MSLVVIQQHESSAERMMLAQRQMMRMCRLRPKASFSCEMTMKTFQHDRLVLKMFSRIFQRRKETEKKKDLQAQVLCVRYSTQ